MDYSVQKEEAGELDLHLGHRILFVVCSPASLFPKKGLGFGPILDGHMRLIGGGLI